MVSYPFHDGPNTTIAHAKSLASQPSKKGFSLDASVKNHIPDNNIFFRNNRGFFWGIHNHTTT